MIGEDTRKADSEVISSAYYVEREITAGCRMGLEGKG
jgi:hypothetical protein